MITNEIAEEAVNYQVSIGAKPLVTKTSINSLFDTFKMKSEDEKMKESNDLVATVTNTASSLNTSDCSGLGNPSFDVLATQRFSSLNRKSSQ